MAISKKIRFEVFKRDSFTCQYCGMAAPDVILHADHIDPKSKGGDDSILNLLTSCSSCNSGKGARPLTDTTVLQKRKSMLNSLQERREQIEMMLQWQKGLESFEDEIIEHLNDLWGDLTGWELNEFEIRQLNTLLRKFPFAEVAEAMKISAEYYLQNVAWGSTSQAVGRAFKKVAGICVNRKRESDNPALRTINHLRAIVRKQIQQFDDIELEKLLLQAMDAGIEERFLFITVRQHRSWDDLEEALNTLIEDIEKVPREWQERD